MADDLALYNGVKVELSYDGEYTTAKLTVAGACFASPVVLEVTERSRREKWAVAHALETLAKKLRE